MFGLFKRNKTSIDGLDDYEEIQEKKTTNAGYLSLIIMAFFLILIGEAVFNDLRRIPEAPTYPSTCIRSIVRYDGYYNNTDYIQPENTLTTLKNYQKPYIPCVFNDPDKDLALDTQYAVIEPKLNQIDNLNNEIQTVDSQINNSNYAIQNLERTYNTSLQEKIANEEVLFNRGKIQSNILSERSKIESLTLQKKKLESEIDSIISQITPSLTSLKNSYDRAVSKYEVQNAWYRIKIFLLTLLFVLPIFAISLKFYFSLKKKNSPYTIIATSVTFASSILFLQAVLTFLYEIIPRALLEKLIQFFTKIPAFRYILYYGTALLVVLVFGGIVYIIQKKIFNPKKVSVRRLKENKCPSCSFTINQFQDFCPKCGLTLKEKCVSCGNKRINSLPFCPVCGKTKNGKNVEELRNPTLSQNTTSV